MRGRLAVIAVVVMVAVLAGSWALTRTGGGEDRYTTLLSFDPLAVKQMTLTRDGRTERLHRLESGAWVIEAEGESWPVDESVMRGALRKLVGLRGEPSNSGFDTAATLSIDGESGPIASIEFSSGRLGGRGLASVDAGSGTETALIDGELLDVFTRSGLRPWRDRRALPLIGAGTTSVGVSSGEVGIELGRARGRWGLIAPFQERADGSRVEAVLRTLGALEFERFAGPEEAPETAALPAAIDLRLVRAGETLRQRLEVVGSVDLGGERVLVSVSLERNGDVWAGATGVVPREVLDEIPTDPAWYASRRAIDLAPADAARIWIEPVEEAAQAPIQPDPQLEARITLERDGLGWSGPNSGASSLYAEGADALLAALCDTDASEVGELIPERYVPIALVQVGGRSGLPVGAAEIGVVESAGGRVAIVRSGHLNRVFDDPAAVGLIEAVIESE